MDSAVAAHPGLAREEGVQLPFDLRTLLGCFWRRRLWLFAGSACIVLLAYFGSRPLARRVYEAETTMLYGTRLAGVTESFYEQPSLRTQLDLVKLPAHLARVREQLELPCDLATLGAAVAVSAAPRTSLVTLRVRWGDAEKAALIANALRRAFLEAGVALRRAEAERLADDFEERLGVVARELRAADTALGVFTRENRIVDLHEEARWLLDQQTTIEILIEKSRVEKRTTALQLEDLGKIMTELNDRITEEKIEAAKFDDVTVASTRSRRLRDLVDEAKKQSERQARYFHKAKLLEDLEKAYAKGAVPRYQVDRARAEYDEAKALAVEGPQMKAWRSEIEKLDKVILPASGGIETASGPLLRQMMAKSFELQLENTSVSDKVDIYEAALRKVRERLARLPALRKEYSILKREIESCEARRRDLHQKLAAARDLVQIDAPAFSVVAEASPSGKPKRSNRRLVFLGASAGGMFLLTVAIALLCLLDRSIKSPAEAQLHVGAPVLAEVDTGGGTPGPGSEEDAAFVFLARRIRHELGQPGARLLVAAFRDGPEGPLCSERLARALRDADENVIAVQSGARDGAGPGFGDLVEEPRTALDDCLIELEPGIRRLPAGSRPVAPARYGSSRVAEILERASRAASVVLIDTAPLDVAPDGLLMAGHADAALLVLPAGRVAAREAAQVATRLRALGTRVIGAVMTDVDPFFSENRR